MRNYELCLLSQSHDAYRIEDIILHLRFLDQPQQDILCHDLLKQRPTRSLGTGGISCPLGVDVFAFKVVQTCYMF